MLTENTKINTESVKSVFPDKTSRLQDFFGGFLTTMSCPDGFGKSLALARANERLEEGKTTDGKTPVMYLDLSTMHPKTYKGLESSVKRVIAKEYMRHRSECEPVCRGYDFTMYGEIISGEADEVDYTDSIDLLTRLLNRKYGEDPVVIIDGGDIPLLYASANGYYSRAEEYIARLYLDMKDNTYMKGCLMSGSTYINDCSLYGGNLLMDNNLPADLIYSLGFSVRETEDILAHYGRTDKLEEVLAWYGGYGTSEGEKVCPGSLLAYIRNGFNPACYKVNKLPGIFGTEAFAGERMEGWLSNLLTAPQQHTIPRTIWYKRVTSTDEGMLSVLCHYGYLAVCSAVREEPYYDSIKCVLTVPNEEMKQLVRELIQSGHPTQANNPGSRS